MIYCVSRKFGMKLATSSMTRSETFAVASRTLGVHPSAQASAATNSARIKHSPLIKPL